MDWKISLLQGNRHTAYKGIDKNQNALINRTADATCYLIIELGKIETEVEIGAQALQANLLIVYLHPLKNSAIVSSQNL